MTFSFLRSSALFTLLSAALVAGAPKLGPGVQSAIDSALAGDQLTLVVTFHGDKVSQAHLDSLRALGISTGLSFQELPIAGVLATPEQARALSRMESVRSLWMNEPLRFLNADATKLTGVQKLRTDATMTYRNNGLPVSGRGIGVLINDSGVDGTHPDLKFGSHLVQNTLGSTNLSRLNAMLPASWVENVPNTDTNSGHGTHAAGSACGDGSASNGKFAGVAPGANVVGYGSGGALLVLDAIGGFNYGLVKQFQYNIRVISNSWGSSGGFDPDNPIHVASKACYDRNIVVTFAAGNEGSAEDTHNPYAKAPWVISVGAGTKDGRLADFSSRGLKGVGGTFTTPDGKTWSWEDRPTVTAPGVGIVSTRAIAPVSSLSAQEDTSSLQPGEAVYYAHMSGTSMATPHLSGIVALMLEANPRLTPAEVKQILQQTATNIPGREAWECGAGYANACAAVDRAFRAAGYGSTVNSTRTFNANATLSVTTKALAPFEYNPVTLVSTNRQPVEVAAGLTELVARIDASTAILETGSNINLVLIAPDGTEHASGVSLTFVLDNARTVSVSNPMAGTWTLEVRGQRGADQNPTKGVGLPCSITGSVRFKAVGGFTGLNDIAGHPAEAAIKLCAAERLMDGYPNSTFKPDQYLSRMEMAKSLAMGDVRQNLPLNGVPTFWDLASQDLPFAEAVTAKGSALRDLSHLQNGVMKGNGGCFSPSGNVNRLDLAYALVQSLGLESNAKALAGSSLTVAYGTTRIAIDDSAEVPAELRGYAQLALDLNILNASFYLTQGPFDLQPTLHARFIPGQKLTRGAYAVSASRFLSVYGQ